MSDEVTGKCAHSADSPDISANRREFLARIPAAAAITVAGTTIPFVSSTEAGQGSSGASHGAVDERAIDSLQVRLEAAQAEAAVPTPPQINRDEQNYPNFIGNFSKGLPM
jgi:hypothetical protein